MSKRQDSGPELQALGAEDVGDLTEILGAQPAPPLTLSQVIERARAAAIMKCFADGIVDPDEQRSIALKAGEEARDAWRAERDEAHQRALAALAAGDAPKAP